MLKRLILILALFAFLTGNQIINENMPVVSSTISNVKTKANNSLVQSKTSSSINDPYYYKQWDIWFTKSDAAWKILKQKKSIRIGLVDSGVDYNHPDLKNRVLKNLGYNFVDDNRNVMDDLGHGTEVAGIIAAEQGNKKGITGVIGNLDAKIIPIKVLDNKGRGPSDIVAQGIRYAADIGCDVINVSIDFDEHDEEIQNSLSYATNKGSLVVVASGNSNSDCDLYSPAGDDGAYTVAAIDDMYKRPYFSSYGSTVRVAAPGVDVLTTTKGGKYDEESGTSISAPIVTGVAAMVKAENPKLGPSDIANIINATATDVMQKGRDESSGYGLVNAYKAVSRAK